MKITVIVLIIGFVIFIVGKALNNEESNGSELTVSAICTVAGFVAIVGALSLILTVGVRTVKTENDRYRNHCHDTAIELLGGQENVDMLANTIGMIR